MMPARPRRSWTAIPMIVMTLGLQGGVRNAEGAPLFVGSSGRDRASARVVEGGDER